MSKQISDQNKIRKKLEILAAMGEVSKLENALDLIGPVKYSQSLREKAYGTKLKQLEYGILNYTAPTVRNRNLPTQSLKQYEEAVQLAEDAKKHGVDLGFNYNSFSDYLNKNRGFFSKDGKDSELEGMDTNNMEPSAIDELRKLERKTYAELVKWHIQDIARDQYNDGFVDGAMLERLQVSNKKAGEYRLDIDSIMNNVQEMLKKYPSKLKYLAAGGLDAFLESCDYLERKRGKIEGIMPSLEPSELTPEMKNIIDSWK